MTAPAAPWLLGYVDVLEPCYVITAATAPGQPEPGLTAQVTATSTTFTFTGAPGGDNDPFPETADLDEAAAWADLTPALTAALSRAVAEARARLYDATATRP